MIVYVSRDASGNVTGIARNPGCTGMDEKIDDSDPAVQVFLHPVPTQAQRIDGAMAPGVLGALLIQASPTTAAKLTQPEKDTLKNILDAAAANAVTAMRTSTPVPAKR